MKNTLLTTLVLLIALSFTVLSLTGCPPEPGGDKPLGGSIAITPPGQATVGTVLTANYSGSEIVSYYWYKDGAAIPGATSRTYTPSEAGSYTVTVSATGYISKTSIPVTVTAANPNNQTPTAADFDIGNLTQTEGSVTAVTITPKAGKSGGAITIYYDGSTTLPTAANAYPVTFDVAAATGWNAASGLSAGTLIIDLPPCTCPVKAHLAQGQTCDCGGKDCDCTVAVKPDLTAEVSITVPSNDMRVGQTATVNIANTNGIGAPSIQWTRGLNADGAFDNISGATNQTYVIAIGDIGYMLGANVSYANTNGAIPGKNTTKVVANEPANKGPFETADLFEGYTANIVDGRINGGTQNLQELGIVTQIENAITNAFNSGVINPARFRNVFGLAENGVTIYVDNPATFYKAKASNSDTIYFHIDYLASLSDADLQTAINSLMWAMNPVSPSLPIEITKAKNPLQGLVFVFGGMHPVKQPAHLANGWKKLNWQAVRVSNAHAT